jgi:PAS domain S-box-containing protein
MTDPVLSPIQTHDLDSALDLIPAPAWIHAEGTIRYANRAMAALLDATCDELIGRPVGSLLDVESRHEFAARNERCLRRERRRGPTSAW